MDYVLMEPPFEMKEFHEMNKREAQQYFDWYMSQVPVRLKQLKEAYAETSGRDSGELDFSPQSLVPLWSWFLPWVAYEPKTAEEIQEELAKLPEWLHESFLEAPYDLSTGTLTLAADIAVYFAEVFRKKYPNLEWGFVIKPKSFMHVNRPILKDNNSTFILEPQHLLHVITLEAAENNLDQEALINLYTIWEGDLN